MEDSGCDDAEKAMGKANLLKPYYPCHVMSPRSWYTFFTRSGDYFDASGNSQASCIASWLTKVDIWGYCSSGTYILKFHEACMTPFATTRS